MLVILIIGFILLLDQSTKFLAQQALSLGQSFPLIKGFLHLSLVHNTGAAFGIFKNQTILFVLISLFAVIFLALFYRKISGGNMLLKLASALVLAGALGNLIDRLRFGYVIDFVDFRIWPVFNVADSCITIGTCIFAYILLFKKQK